MSNVANVCNGILEDLNPVKEIEKKASIAVEADVKIINEDSKLLVKVASEIRDIVAEPNTVSFDDVLGYFRQGGL